jgi:hypothetical protein
MERGLARDGRGRGLRLGWVIETERHIASGGGRRRRRCSSPRDTRSAGTAQIGMPCLPSGRVIWKRWPWPSSHACWGEARRRLDPASADRPGRSHAFVQNSASRRSSSARDVPLGSEMTFAAPDQLLRWAIRGPSVSRRSGLRDGENLASRKPCGAAAINGNLRRESSAAETERASPSSTGSGVGGCRAPIRSRDACGTPAFVVDPVSGVG